MINWKKVEMGFYSCFGRRKGVRLNKDEETKGMRLNKDEETKGARLNKDEGANLEATQAADDRRVSFAEGTSEPKPRRKSSVSKDNINAENSASTFSYWELAAATNNFCEESVIGEGGFGSVYKGKLRRTDQVVAIKKLNPSGVQGTKEFLVEVLMLSLLHHPNLVKLIGFCAEGEERLLVYEYMPLGSLEHHLHDRLPDVQALDWNTRMTIAAGVASGLDYLHNEADPPVIHRDLKPSNILLGEGFHPKLSDFGLAKFGPSGDKSHVSTRVMGTYGYCAPEYCLTGRLTVRSDVYCFGMVFLELITGLKAMDETRPRGQHGLLDWLRPLLKDPENFMQIADPETRGQFSETAFRRALELALRCLHERAHSRPNMKDVVPAINFLKSLVPAAAHSTSDARERVSGEEGRNEDTAGPEGFENVRQQARKVNKDQEWERTVAEAKLWGETLRDKMPASKDEGGSELHKSKTS